METALNGIPVWLIVVVLIWSLAWKGVALWKSAQIGDKRWFIAILVLNTIGILEIIYIRFIASKYSVDVEEK
ncbi:MAG TPA: DUF5652 family protein [Candidatus Paceibacterota bacterium]